MKLLISLTSPYARKVRIVLQEKRVDCQMVIDVPWDADTDVPDYNPLGKVPVLVLDDGATLYDSRVIVEYIDHISPVSQLIPKEHRQAVAVKRWEALADGICDAAATSFLERKRPAKQQSPEWIARQETKIARGLRAMSEELGERLWCNGENYSLADIAVGVCLGYVDLRFGHLPWRDQYPNLAKLAEKLAQRPAFADTVPPSA